MSQTKIVVIDDDPTGSQTVHSCLLLTRWDEKTLQRALLDSSPLFFVLSNSRGMGAGQAADVTREICCNLRKAVDVLNTEKQQINLILVSRSDSTLRGHYPVETDIIEEEMGPFDAHFLTPAFFEGGRITRDNVHYLKINDEFVPVHKTEFANDSVFSFTHSYLPDYVEEKTNGRIKANEVQRFTLKDVRGVIHSRLSALENNTCCVVDAECQQDMDNFAKQLRDVAGQGKRFLFRSAASLLTSLAELPPQAIAAESMAEYVRNAKPGAVIVGSHVKKTTTQLNELLKVPGAIPVEVDVSRIESARQDLLHMICDRVDAVHNVGNTPVIFTSRVELVFPDQKSRLAFGELVSDFLMDVVRGLPKDIGFLISKGGITSNDVLSSGLALQTSRVVGQILAGCSVVCCPSDHPRYPDLPVVIFPGNVGDEFALATVYTRLSGRK